MSVMDLTNAVLDLLPSMPSGVKVYRQEEPLESEMPPWIIAREPLPHPAAGLHGRPAHPVRGFRRVRGRSDRRRHRAPLPGARPEVPLHVEPTIVNQSFTKSLQGHPIRGGLLL